jgi:hypothetical protein
LYGIWNASAKAGRELGGSGGILPHKNLEFLDSLERYFMRYFRSRFEEKLLSQKPFLS